MSHLRGGENRKTDNNVRPLFAREIRDMPGQTLNQYKAILLSCWMKSIHTLCVEIGKFIGFQSNKVF